MPSTFADAAAAARPPSTVSPPSEGASSGTVDSAGEERASAGYVPCEACQNGILLSRRGNDAHYAPVRPGEAAVAAAAAAAAAEHGGEANVNLFAGQCSPPPHPHTALCYTWEPRQTRFLVCVAL